ncbi:hypothetical protein [Amycolatopsis keratiniphila]|uniref:Uncharacterized protein n=1 Tax=Amycolatopsis keratiniphila TaxID=129921 RepID=R4T3E1_9PSEU|nr:hypothetical protein [Amycolatopsis keratiniphila]AGM10129.1 hypothetical protein AORI_7547 [Amycolatopsis keratiniphila]
MTTNLQITCPDAAAHSAKNAPTAPGPDQPAKDSKGFPMVEEETRAYAARTRERAVRQLNAGLDVVSEWVNLVRQCTEMRTDSFRNEDLFTDASYREALGRFAQLSAAVTWFNERGPVIEAGEVL